MLRKSLITTACAASILMTMSAMPAGAQTSDSRTEFTFSHSVELPGVTLPPGSYVFRLADSAATRNVMQVIAKDSTNKNYGFFITLNAERPTPPDDAELRFMETAAGQPAAIKTWWYPGTKIGREFIYPRSQALRLARATNQTVLSTQAESVSNEQMQTASLSRVSPSGEDEALSDAQLVEAAANTAPVGTAGAARAPAQEATMARTSLPKTGTPLPGIGLLGLLSLLGAASIRK